MNPKKIFTVILVLFSFSFLAQEIVIDTKLFSVTELQEDFNYWRNQLANKHPIIYHYNSQKSFNEYFDSVYLKIDRPMTKTDFFRLIGPTTSFTKCGHSQVYAGSEIQNNLMKDDHLIPIDLEWFHDKAYVTYNYTSDSNLAAGTEVIAINGVSVEDLYKKSMAILPGDGYSKSYADFWVNRQFYYYYHLLFGLYEKYEISTAQDDGSIKNILCDGLSVIQMDSIEELRPKLIPEHFEGINHYFIDSLNTAVLRVGSFFNADFKKVHEKQFKKVVDENLEDILSAEMEYLIIDIRGNDGGQPANPLYLLRYLMNEPFEFKHELRTLKNKKEVSFHKRSRKVLIPDSQVGIFKPFKNQFQGKIYLLVDGGSTSAAGEFSSVIRRYKRGAIIGTETGGNPILLTGFGIGSTKKLPNTKLPISLGKRTTLMDDVSHDTAYGLIPNVIIEPTILDYLNAVDPELNYVLNEIKNL